jgi:hypothetical protein
MLDQLIALVKQFAGETIVNNPAIPNEHNEEAMAEASSTVVSGLQNILAGGGLQNIISLFSSAGNNGKPGSMAGLSQNPIVNMMAGHFMKKLMAKFGLNSSAASGIASNLIPNVLNGLITKTKDPNDSSIDLNSIIKALTGGNVPVAESANTKAAGGFNFQDLINNFTGGGNSGAGNAGGGFNFQDIINQVTQGAQQNQQQQAQQESNGTGGLMDLIKGFIK